jgi:hypothetical protein
MSDPSLDQDAYLNEHITNQLFGVQLGFNAKYFLCRRLQLFITPKFGVYNNQIDHLFQVYLDDNSVIATQTYYPGQTYPVRSSTDVVSFLTQIDIGFDWEISCNWSAQFGYRVVAATGMGLADNQIPPYVVDIPEIADIDYNGDLILHGAFFGVAYNY